MADEKQASEETVRDDSTESHPAKGKKVPSMIDSKELKGLANAQKPRGILSKIKGDASTRPGPLPVPAKRNVSAFTPPSVVDRWNNEAAGVQAVEIGDNVITMFGMVGEDFWTGDGITAKKTAAQLRAIGPKAIEVHINSFGGDMFEGIAIFNVLREHPYDVTVKVMGIAASAASIITMAGDKVEVGSGSFIMIHNCSVMGGGNRNDFLEMAAFLDPFDRAMADVYAERTGLDAAAISKMMDDETYMSGSVAVEKGFADGILTADKVKTDEKAKAAAHEVNELRAMELQLVAAGMPRSEARERINKIKGTPGAAHEEGTPGAALATDDVRSAEPKAGELEWSDLTTAIAAFRS